MSDDRAAPTHGMAVEWQSIVQSLMPVGAEVLATVPQSGEDWVRQETWRGLFMSMAQGVIAHVASDPDYPQFISLANSALNIVAPNPDFMYSWAPINGGGIYRITGFRSTALFVEISILDGLYALPHNRGTLGTIDLDTLAIADDGSFELILSHERPEGYAGNWLLLPPEGDNLLVRSACDDWLNQRDVRLAIERLDVPAPRPRASASQIAERLAALPGWIERSHARHHGRIADLAEREVVNRLNVHDYAAWGGAAGQIYMEGLFDIGEDEALILETEVPDRVRYWGFMVTDNQIGTVDWVNRQSSINGFQATIDDDGRFRAVISRRDPGVPNWLDTGGYGYGMIWGRWNDASSSPVPIVKKVPLAEVRRHLPADTAVVSERDRDVSLRERRRGAQLRQPL